MIGTVILITIAVGLGAIVWVAFSEYVDSEEAMRELAESKSPFEKVQPFPFDHAQLQRLRSKVDRLGVLRTDEVVQAGRHAREVTFFHVFLIDSEGEVRDIVKTEDLTHASKTAYGLANIWSVPLEDRDHILDDRYATASLEGEP